MKLDGVIFTSEEHSLNSNTTFIRSLSRTHSLVDFQPDSLLHGHDFIEIAFVVDGTAVHQMTSKDENVYSKTVSEGDVLFITPGDFHTFIFGKDEYLVLENVIINPVALYNSYFSAFYEREKEGFFFKQRNMPISSRASQQLKLTSKELKRVLKIAQKMRAPEVTESINSAKLIELILLELLYELDNIFNSSTDTVAVGRDAGIHKAILYIQNNYTNKITVEDVAKVACCSRRQVERMYKYYTGETIVNSINRLRISRACFLLINSDMKITSIALDIGIDNISYFNKIFKSRIGVTPREYRRNAKKK